MNGGAHRLPRRILFTPLGCADFRVGISKMETGRLTRMISVVVVWGGDQTQKSLAQHFVGETCCRLKGDASMFDTPSDANANVGHMCVQDACLAERQAQVTKADIAHLEADRLGMRRLIKQRPPSGNSACDVVEFWTLDSHQKSKMWHAWRKSWQGRRCSKFLRRGICARCFHTFAFIDGEANPANTSTKHLATEHTPWYYLQDWTTCVYTYMFVLPKCTQPLWCSSTTIRALRGRSHIFPHFHFFNTLTNLVRLSTFNILTHFNHITKSCGNFCRKYR